MIEEENNTMQIQCKHSKNNYALSKEKEGGGIGFTSSQQAQELLRRENHLQIQNVRWMITTDD